MKPITHSFTVLNRKTTRLKMLVATILFLIAFSNANAQGGVKIGNNPTTIGTSSVLELESTAKGFVMPRMTSAQMTAITTPVAGMQVYCSDSSCVCQYNGTAWRSLCGGNIGSPYQDWHLTGNAGTNASTNFIGTTDAVAFVTKTNNTERMRVTSAGTVGIGTSTVYAPLNVFRSAAAPPSTSGTTTTAIGRFEAQNNAMDLGAFTASPYGTWIQSTAVNDLSYKGPLALNPNGGYIGIGTAGPSNKLEIVNDGVGGANDDIGIKTYGASKNPQLFMQTANGTQASPTNLTTGDDMGGFNFWAQVNGSGQLLNRITNTYTGSGTSVKSAMSIYTSGVEHFRMDSMGRTMYAINTSVYAPKTSVHIYGDGTSDYVPLGTALKQPAAGPEIGFARGGFYQGVGATIQFLDYDAYSGGLAFNVHRGQTNSGMGQFADNWPIDVIQAMTIVNNGKIGLNTGDPQGRFDIRNDTVGGGYDSSIVFSMNGNIGIGFSAPSAYVQIKAGTASANTAPLKFTAGVASQTTKEAGAVNYDGSNLTLSDASTVYTLAKVLTGSAVLDFASTAATAVTNLTITVTGAAVGDPVILGIPNAAVTTTATYTAWVSAANTVTVRFSPKATENPASGTFNVRVIK